MRDRRIRSACCRWSHAALAEAGWTLASLDGLAFGAGPGSFTGIRIGCGVAQGLALGADLPVVPIPTLAAIAQEVFRTHGWDRVLACLDARMREVYTAAYARDGGEWREVAPPAVRRARRGPARARCRGWRLVRRRQRLCRLSRARRRSSGSHAVAADARPTAQSIGELALPRLVAGEGVAAGAALPLYVRHRVALTSAEQDAGVRL